MELKDNAFQRQFEANIDGKMITIEYSVQERKLFLTRIHLPDGFENEEQLNEMIASILEQAIEKKQKVVPVFPKIAAFFRKNAKYKDLLPPGIKL